MSNQRLLHEFAELLTRLENRHRHGGGPADGGRPVEARHGGGPADGGRPAGLEERRAALTELEEQVRVCRRCPLHQGRTNAVPGAGVLDPRVMVIGEGPGGDEDRRGVPFVGRAGQYLDKWLSAIGLSRDRDVYITNIVKCRPPDNRDPQTAEIDACTPYLSRQIDIIRPFTILAVGRFAANWITGRTSGIGKLRGRTFDYKGVPVVVTYHPSGVLRNPEYRRPVWDDLKRVREIYSESTGEA
ncbi:MAG: uracil-DNA glycosylase [Spirochaetota bacterium]